MTTTPAATRIAVIGAGAGFISQFPRHDRGILAIDPPVH